MLPTNKMGLLAMELFRKRYPREVVIDGKKMIAGSKIPTEDEMPTFITKESIALMEEGIVACDFKKFITYHGHAHRFMEKIKTNQSIDKYIRALEDKYYDDCVK